MLYQNKLKYRVVLMDLIMMMIEARVSGWDSLVSYLAEHTVTCLVPAFFIAGAIAAFIKKDAILRYFGPNVERWKSFSLASVSGIVLAVCSCTILPLFAGIYKKGSGLGPAVAFLFSGPGINLLAIVYTATILGYDIGLARAFFAIIGAFVIGLTMVWLFRSHDRELMNGVEPFLITTADNRSRYQVIGFFVALVAILIIAASQLSLEIRAVAVAVLVGAVMMMWRWFKRDELNEWGWETWDLSKKIIPVLLAGTFLVGVIAYFLPPETFQPYLGGESLASVLLASILGTILYMPTLLEVPIIGTTFGYLDGMMGSGPALALLLSGPTVSLPSIVVLYRIMGGRKTIAYMMGVIVYATVAGLIYGYIV